MKLRMVMRRRNVRGAEVENVKCKGEMGVITTS